jgi:hypothetical protein
MVFEMTKKEASIHLKLVHTASVGGTLFVQVSFFLGTHVEPMPLGWENLPIAMIAVAGLLSLLLCTISARVIINHERAKDA